MYIHVSMFRIKNREKIPDALTLIREKLRSFPEHIPSIQNYQVVENFLPHPNVPVDSPLLFCDLIQIAAFQTAAELEAYPQDPYHRKLVQETDGLLEQVCVIDYKDLECV